MYPRPEQESKSLTSHSVIDELTHRIVLHLHSTADSSFGPAKNEFIVTFKTTEDGKQIREQHEFMDSAAFGQLMSKLKAQ